jgi:hypothetical protein
LTLRASRKSVAIFRIGELFFVFPELAHRRAIDQSVSRFDDEYLSCASSTREAVSKVSPPKKSPQSTPSQVAAGATDCDWSLGIPSTVIASNPFF